jgi:hypothetical protein
MMDECGYISLFTSVVSLLLIVSEMLPYASSSRCNSIVEALSHIMCKNNCLKSNKAIMYDNNELIKEVSHLKTEIKNLTTLRTSLEMERINENV